MSLTVAGCATPTDLQAPQHALLHERWFNVSAKTAAAVAEDPFALSGSMDAWLHETLATRKDNDLHRLLVNALYRGGTLTMAYDAQRTRSAAEAFEARAGNCLSLVIMTAAFARALDLQVTYQQVDNGSVWERNRDLDVRIGHVNIVLTAPLISRNLERDGLRSGLIVDFMPEPARDGTRFRTISEARVLAMYRTNRAVEALFENRIDEAYAWVRAALQADEHFGDAWNALAVVVRRRGEMPDGPPSALVTQVGEAALRHALAMNADDTSALSNLALLLKRTGRNDEAARLLTHLHRIEPLPPLAALDQGMQALRDGDPRAARRIFETALRREPDSHALHHGLAIALFQTGYRAAAAEELERAGTVSASPAQRALYAAKREHVLGDGGAASLSKRQGHRADAVPDPATVAPNIH